MVRSIRSELLGDRGSSTDPGATSLIRFLLQAAASEAESANNDILMGFSAVRAARLSCDTIDTVIVHIDGLPKNDSRDDEAWKLFQHYRNGILDLEKLLLEQHVLLQTQDFKLEARTVEECLLKITVWESRRTGITSHLQKLHKLYMKIAGTPCPHEDFTWEQQCDDTATLRQLRRLLDEVLPTIAREKMKPMVDDLMTALPKLVEKPSGLVEGIKVAWLVHAAILEANGNDEGRKWHLKNFDGIPVQIKRFAGVITNKELDKFQGAREELTSALRGTTTPSKQSFYELLCASKAVTRPFMHQNMVLLNYCCDLVTLYNRDENEPTRAVREVHVVRALKTAQETVEKAVGAKLTETKNWAPGNDPERVKAAYGATASRLKQCLALYDVAKSEQIERAMSTAALEDSNHLQPFSERVPELLAAARRPFNEPGVTVTVKIDAGSAGEGVEYQGSTPISSVIWHQNSKHPTRKFTGAKHAGVPVSLDDTVRDVFKGARSFELELVERGDDRSMSTVAPPPYVPFSNQGPPASPYSSSSATGLPDGGRGGYALQKQRPRTFNPLGTSRREG